MILLKILDEIIKALNNKLYKMKNKIALVIGVFLLLLTSCNNKKELELKEKELKLREQALIVKEDSINQLKNVENNAVEKTSKTSKRELRYLYAANGGLLGYFNDGTTAGCPGCDFCKSNVDGLYTEKPSGTYANDEVVNEIKESGEDIKSWVLIDYQWKAEVPQF
jgi:hypothetical protein